MKKDLKYYLSLHYPHTVDQYEENGETYYALDLPDLPGCGASGKTYEEALTRLNSARELWIEESYKRGLSIPEPVSEDDFSGKFLLRIPAKLHMELSKHAKSEGLSLNQYVRSVLEKEISFRNKNNGFTKLMEQLNLIQSHLSSQNEKIQSIERKLDCLTQTSNLQEIEKNDPPAILKTLLEEIWNMNSDSSQACYLSGTNWSNLCELTSGWSRLPYSYSKIMHALEERTIGSAIPNKMK